MTYASRLLAKLDPNHPSNISFGQPKFRMSSAMDEAAELKLTGGFVIKKSNRCDRCFTFKPVNGECC